jgi:hypothetical protein
LALETDAAKDAASAKIDDQLQGVSTGAGLAAALRPAGLVFLPQPSARGVVYRIGKPGAGTFWPIGVIPKQRNVEIAPKLLEMEDVEITDTPLPETLTAIRERLSLPFLFDYNAMATHGVEPAKVNITLPAKRLAYIQILQKVLFQAKLKAELRTDDAGKPFLWITTIKPAQ